MAKLMAVPGRDAMPPQAPAPLGKGLLPIPSRQEAVPPPTAGLPIASRQAVPLRQSCGGGAQQPGHSYIVETITTPVRKGKRFLGRRHTGRRTGAAQAAAAGGDVGGRQVSGGPVPRWTHSPAACDPSPVDSNVSSLNSSQLQALELDSNASFGFVPGVFAQSWHRKLSETYNIVTCVGEGRSGAVFIVQHKRTEKLYACKFLRKVDHDPETLRREIMTLRNLDHPNIVRLYEVNEDKDTVFLLMELCQGGDLYEHVYEEGRLDESTACALAHQMLSALAYCHESGVVHRDVKPENFLLEHADEEFPTIKLADFGIATSIRPAHLSGSLSSMLDSHASSGSGAWPSFNDGEMPGSLPYMAPEVLTHQWKSLVRGAESVVEVLAASDLWSCGVSLYVMLSGELPFGDDPEACLQEIIGGKPPDFSGESWQRVSKEAKDLIMRLLNPSVAERWTAAQALGHDWFHTEESPSDVPGAMDMLSPTVPGGFSDFAGAFIRVLRVWRHQPKLRRIAIVAIARKLEEQHEIHRVAQAALALFGDAAERLSCESLVEALGGAGCGGGDDTSLASGLPATPSCGVGAGRSGAAPRTPATVDSASRLIPGVVVTSPSPSSTVFPSAASVSSASPASAPVRRQSTRTGLHVRRRLRHLARGLSGLAEETPTATPTPGSSSTPSLFGRCSPRVHSLGGCAGVASEGPLVSLTELRHLIGALDARKDGYVDYTLLVASLLPVEVYSEQGRIAEVFELFDLQKTGSVGPRDLHMTLMGVGSEGRRRDASLRQITDMLAEFDLDGDGRLSFAEFAEMVRGGTRADTPAMETSRRGGA